MRHLLSSVLEEEGYEVICFADGAALLASARERIPACIFLEVRLPGGSGIDILKELRTEKCPAPIFMVSGESNIPTVVAAIKSGASDFIEKPFCAREIAARVRVASERLSRSHNVDHSSKTTALYLPGHEPLTRREQDVLALLAEGATNKEAGKKLGLSPRTIEGHRANIMRKAGARNAAELFRHIISGAF
jgi:FixJ family two-component response regulator